jgi:hypothetical protein
VKWLLSIIAVLVAGVLGYGYYLHRKLEAVMSAPSAQVRLEPYALKPLTVQTRPINLGFAHFELPASLGGEPVRVGDDLLIVLDANEGILFGSPFSDFDAGVASMLASASVLADHPVGSLFELKKQALAARPFTVWSLPVLGKKRAIFGATMVSLKGLFSYAAPVVGMIEMPELGLFIAQTPDRTVIAVHDRRKGISQEFVIPPAVADVDQIVAALAASYRFTSDETSNDKWIDQMNEAGVRSRHVTSVLE